MSKPRKKYRPRLARTDVFALAIQGTALLAKSDQATMAEPVKLAVDRIAQARITVSVPDLMSKDCRYTHTDLGRVDAKCAGCEHRAKEAA